MARITVPTITIERSGVSAAAQVTGDPTEGHKIESNTGRSFIEVENTDASAHTVTVVTSATVDDLDVADRTVSVPAGQKRYIGPFPITTYNQTDGSVNIDVDDATLLLRAFKI